jgi:PHD/YefM family antitoxin component YafN of YafNO toxin-antitoxin module
MDDILSQLKETPVTLEKHNREVAVLEDPQRYAAMREALDAATDLLLAFDARCRETSGKGRDSSLEEVEKRFL